MPRLLNVQIPNEKRVLIGLTYIPGIGLSRSKLICKELEICHKVYMKELTKKQLSKIDNFVRQHFKVGPKIKTDIISNIKHLINVSSYRGIRHFKGLPLRGQRTKTNAKTSRSSRMAI